MNYLEDIKINESALDIEWLRQPSLVFHYSKIAADQRKHLDKRKERLALIKADLDKEIRSNPEKYKLEKLTETGISNCILTQSEYTEAMADVIDTQYEVNMAQVAVAALQDKRTALENLVRLFGQQYFAGPSVPRNITKEWEEKEKQKNTNTKIGESLGRRRRT